MNSNDSNQKRYILIIFVVLVVVINIFFLIIINVNKNKNNVKNASNVSEDNKTNEKEMISIYENVDKDVLTYLKENYPEYEFQLAPDYSMMPIFMNYLITEKSGKYISANISYNMESKEIERDTIPVAFISNQFEDFICNKLKEAFSNSKVYMLRNKWTSDDWKNWNKYEFSLENYIGYLQETNVTAKTFFVVADNKDIDNRLKNIEKFYQGTDITKYHYISFRLIYVPTEYVNQADKYYTGGGFATNTEFYKVITSDEIISVLKFKDGVELHSTKDKTIKRFDK